MRERRISSALSGFSSFSERSMIEDSSSLWPTDNLLEYIAPTDFTLYLCTVISCPIHWLEKDGVSSNKSCNVVALVEIVKFYMILIYNF